MDMPHGQARSIPLEVYLNLTAARGLPHTLRNWSGHLRSEMTTDSQTHLNDSARIETAEPSETGLEQDSKANVAGRRRSQAVTHSKAADIGELRLCTSRRTTDASGCMIVLRTGRPPRRRASASLNYFGKVLSQSSNYSARSRHVARNLHQVAPLLRYLGLNSTCKN